MEQLLAAKFIRTEKHPEWLAKVVPVKKKNGQICLCVDFLDLNKWPFSGSFVNWSSRYILPAFSYLYLLRRFWPFRTGEQSSDWSYPFCSYFDDRSNECPSPSGSYECEPYDETYEMRAAYISTFFISFVYTECTSLVRGADDDALLRRFPVGRLCFKTEGAGKRRVFAIQNAFKQALLRPCHDWCMSVLK